MMEFILVCVACVVIGYVLGCYFPLYYSPVQYSDFAEYAKYKKPKATLNCEYIESLKQAKVKAIERALRAIARAEAAESNYADVQQKRNELTEQVAKLMRERDEALQQSNTHYDNYQFVYADRKRIADMHTDLIKQFDRQKAIAELYRRAAKQLIQKRRACLQWVRVIAHRGIVVQR